MRKTLCLLFLLGCMSEANSQNFGNSSLLKYGLTQNQLSVDVAFQGFNLTNSPAKYFVLKNAPNNGFAAAANFHPIENKLKSESSGESIVLRVPQMVNGISVSYERTSNVRKQGFLSFNNLVRLKKNKPQFRLSGYIITGNQSLIDDRQLASWQRNDRNTNGYLKLSSKNYNAKNYLSFEGFGITNKGDITQRLENQGSTANTERGDLLMLKLNWNRKISANHSLISSITSEHFSNTLSIEPCLSCNNEFSFSSLKIHIEDEIRLKKTKFNTALIVTDNKQRLLGRGQRLEGNYTLGMLHSRVVYFFKANKNGIAVGQGLGMHTVNGIIYNPSVKFFSQTHRVQYDVGYKRVTRTPSLLTEFGSWLDGASPSLITTDQENVNKVFATTKFLLNSHVSMEFKYVQTSSPNKWLYSQVDNALTQQKFKHSAVYVKLYRSLYRHSRLMLLYRNITPESKSADILANHYVSGNYEFHVFNRSKRIFKRYRTFDFSVDLKTSYLSAHNLPYSVNGQQAVHDGGFFADSHLKLRIGRRDSYYRYKLKPIRLQRATIRLGLNNILNTRSTLQPIEGNNFKPIMPRQVFTSITFEI